MKFGMVGNKDIAHVMEYRQQLDQDTDKEHVQLKKSSFA